jgi:hypothetical protein
MKKIVTLICILAVSITTTRAQTPPETLTNKTIITLQKAGIGASTLESMIANAPCKFTTDSRSLIELKQNGISDDVITAMLNKASHTSFHQGSANTEGGTDIVGQLKSQGTGLYVVKDGSTIEELEPTVYSANKRGSGLLTSITDGLAKTKNKMAVNGSKANLQLTNRRPVFYFYFYDEGGNLNEQSPKWFANASSPNEFMLIKFDQSKSGTSREVVTGTYNILQGNVEGVDDNNKRTFQFKK